MAALDHDMNRSRAQRPPTGWALDRRVHPIPCAGPPVFGAIDLYDRFTFVEVPRDRADHVLAGMRHVKIRNRPVRVKLATPRAEEPRRRPRDGGPRRQVRKGRRVA